MSVTFEGFFGMSVIAASVYLGGLVGAPLVRREAEAGAEALGAVAGILALGALTLGVPAMRDGAWLQAAVAVGAMGFLGSLAGDAWSRSKGEIAGERWPG